MQLADQDYWQKMNASSLLGLSPAGGSRAAGHALPPTTVAGGDKAMIPWHPDSPYFWLAVIAGGTVLGMFGASARVRVLKGSAGVEVGRA